MSDEVHSYIQLQQHIHHALRVQHPDSVEPDGSCPTPVRVGVGVCDDKPSIRFEHITDALEKVITAINQANASEQEKNEAKSLLRKLLSSKAAAEVLGAGAQSLAAKYFTG